MIRLKNKYPVNDGISLYNFQKLPDEAIKNVSTSEIRHIGTSILYDGTINFSGDL